jgi:hypothetical protein
MKNTALRRLRWRLLLGIVSLVTAVAVTLPAAASRVDLGQRVADIWPNGLTEVADVIWPNGAELMDVIWPNAAVLGDSLAGSSDSDANQDAHGN